MCVAAEDLSAEVAQRFGSALQLAWRANDSSLLRQVLPSDATVTTPLWQCADRTDYERELLEVAAFFSERATPVLSVLSHRRDKISNEFLRKHAERGRGEAKGGAAGLRMTMGTAQMMYATGSL